MEQLAIDGFSFFVGFLSGITVVIAFVTVGIAYFELKSRAKNKIPEDDTNVRQCR